jgi:hypothetical protein
MFTTDHNVSLQAQTVHFLAPERNSNLFGGSARPLNFPNTFQSYTMSKQDDDVISLPSDEVRDVIQVVCFYSIHHAPRRMM